MRGACSIVAVLVVSTLFAASAHAGTGKPAFPSWSQRIDGPKRFTVLQAFGGAAVLDGETGLVWEQAPSAGTMVWANTHAACNRSTTGGRMGWRVPTLQELASLVDPDSSGGDPDLPPDHPFSNVESSTYWSATGVVGDEDAGWGVNFEAGAAIDTGKSNLAFVWCVRGGSGVELQ